MVAVPALRSVSALRSVRVLHVREETATLRVPLLAQVAGVPVLGIICNVYVTVPEEFILPRKTFAAHFTFERGFAGVAELVNLELVPPIVLHRTERAHVLGRLGVPRREMLLDVQGTREHEITFRTGIGFKPGVYAHVVLEIGRTPERFGAHLTAVRFNLRVSAHVSVELVLHGELLAALRAAVGVLGVLRVVQLLVGNHGAPNLEHLTALVTRVLPNVAVDRQMSFDLSLGEIFCTNFTLGQFSFFEHVLLHVMFNAHFTGGFKLTITLQTSKQEIYQKHYTSLE